MFIEAGLINEADDPCRLMFYTKLDAHIYGLQSEEYDESMNDERIPSDIIKRGKQYLLCELYALNNEELSIKCHTFNTVETKVKKKTVNIIKMYDDTFIKKPVDVFSNKEHSSLAFIPAIRKRLVSFLTEKKVLLLSVHTKQQKKKSIMCLVDGLIRKILIQYCEQVS